MKRSVTATLTLKLFSFERSSLQTMNSAMSGWSTRRIPMLAPLRNAPCWIESDAFEKTSMNVRGPAP